MDLLPNVTGKYTNVDNYYVKKGVIKNQFKLEVVSEEKIEKLLNKINPSKSTGLDKIPGRFIKDGAKVISSPIAHLINLSLYKGIVPDCLKEAKVVPLYKKNSKSEVGNYRPVSILNVLSKILEKEVHEQFQTYLNKANLIYPQQSGFRPNYSTDTCLIHLIDKIKAENDKGNYTGMCLIDLQKAFDTVNHDILLHKLKAMGANETTLTWFGSYLKNRTQLVEVSGTRSEFCKILCGVPQGSILGPLLFLCYCNDMETALNCTLLLYADDSALIVSSKHVPFIEDTLSKELSCLSEWLIDNRLSLHLGKTETILFGSKRRLRSFNKLSVKCNNVDIKSTSNVTYLGEIIDQDVSGESMAKDVITKSCRKVKYLYRQCRNFDKDTKRNLASALVLCHLDYSASSWYHGLTAQTKKQLQITQNKIIRFVLGKNNRAHIGFDEFSNLLWLPVPHRVTQLQLNHMFKIKHNSAPNYLCDQFQTVASVHTHETRASKGSFWVPQVNTNGKKTFMYTGITAWNGLPPTIRCEEKYGVFRKAVKKELLNRVKLNETNEFVYY